jgi:hypothetical protein
MRYVIVDPEGSSRAYFGSLREVREWARALKDGDPELLDEMLLMTYDANDNEVANQWLGDFVPDVPASIARDVAAQEMRSASPFSVTEGLVAGGLLVGWSGTATSKSPVSPRQHRDATDTGSRELAEMAVG